MYPNLYYPDLYFPAAYYPHVGSSPPPGEEEYYGEKYYPDPYFPSLYYPHKVETPPTPSRSSGDGWRQRRPRRRRKPIIGLIRFVPSLFFRGWGTVENPRIVEPARTVEKPAVKTPRKISPKQAVKAAVAPVVIEPESRLSVLHRMDEMLIGGEWQLGDPWDSIELIEEEANR